MIKIKKKIYYWSSDTRSISGEGILANKFLKDLSKYFKNYKLVPLNNSKEDNYKSFYSKYIKSLLIITKIWKYHLQGNKVAFINYLPIWNFIIFLVLPSRTILGPITGTVYNDKFDLGSRIKYLILEKVFYKLSIFIFFSKWRKLLFSTNMLYFTLPRKFHYKCQFNYILNDYKIVKKKKISKHDSFLIYFRNHPSKYNLNFFYQIKKLSIKYNFAFFGDIYKFHNAKNYGTVKEDKLSKIMSKYNFTFNGLENFYSLHLLKSIKNNLIVICDNSLKKYNFHFKTSNIIYCDFNDKNMSKKIINLLSKRKFHKKKIKNIKIKINLKKYFDNYL